MKKIHIVTLALALSALALCSCSKEVYYYEPVGPCREFYLLTLTNNTSSEIVCFVPEHGDVPCAEVTGELPAALTDELKDSFIRIPGRRSCNITIVNDGTLSPIETYHPEDAVTFYFFDAKTLDGSEWSEVVEGQKWLDRRSFKVEDVIKAGKEITFPFAD